MAAASCKVVFALTEPTPLEHAPSGGEGGLPRARRDGDEWVLAHEVLHLRRRRPTR